MAYDFVAASSQYLSVGSAPVTSTPYTLSVFGRPNQTNLDCIGLALSNSSDSHRSFLLFTSGARIRAGSIGISSDYADTTATYSQNVYSVATAVFASQSSRTAYLDGGNSVSNASSVTQSSMTELSIGARRSTTFGAFMDGRLAEVAVWNVALTDAEVASLGKGFKPTRIRPQSLVFYAPLIRDLQDVKGALAITNNNSATVADHPRVY